MALAAVALAGCSGGSSSPSSRRPVVGCARRRPTSTATRRRRRWPSATRGRWPFGNMDDRAGAWPTRGAGRPPNALTRLERGSGRSRSPRRRSVRTPALAHAVRRRLRDRPGHHPGQALARRADRVGAARQTRRCCMHRDGRRLEVAGDVTGRNGVVSGGMFLYTHPTLLSGHRATVVVSDPGTARDEAREILAQMDASAPGLAARYGGGPAAAQRRWSSSSTTAHRASSFRARHRRGADAAGHGRRQLHSTSILRPYQRATRSPRRLDRCT